MEELRGDLAAAEACHRESLRQAGDLADENSLAFALEGLACVAAARRQPERAAVLLGAAESIRARTGSQLPLQERADVARAAGAAAGDLGREAFDLALDRGRRMSTGEVLAQESRDMTEGRFAR